MPSGITPGGHGRFDGFDVLAQARHWDQVTAGVVLARLEPPGELVFFTAAERLTADALFDLLLGQDREPRVPVLHMVDARLASNETDGWRYADLPEDRQAWRDTLAALDRDASPARFHTLDTDKQSTLVQAVQDATEWHGWQAAHVWSLWSRYACAAFYSHPWAWNEIGFGGPAYPRGYKNIGAGRREGWEAAERDPHDPVTH